MPGLFNKALPALRKAGLIFGAVGVVGIGTIFGMQRASNIKPRQWEPVEYPETSPEMHASETKLISNFGDLSEFAGRVVAVPRKRSGLHVLAIVGKKITKTAAGESVSEVEFFLSDSESRYFDVRHAYEDRIPAWFNSTKEPLRMRLATAEEHNYLMTKILEDYNYFDDTPVLRFEDNWSPRESYKAAKESLLLLTAQNKSSSEIPSTFQMR